MPFKINSMSTTTGSTDKISGKPVINNIMDDAPLFAGLDDYNFKQSVRVKAERAKKEPLKEKKKTVQRQVKKTETDGAPPQTAPKTKSAPPSESGAMLLSVTEMCTLLKISRATLVRMDKSGQLPGRLKLGGSVRFHRETVETWLQSLITTRQA